MCTKSSSLFIFGVFFQIMFSIAIDPHFLELRYSLMDRDSYSKFTSLIGNQFDIHGKTKEGWTLLHFATRYDVELDIIKYLLRNGAKINAEATDGATPLMLAAQFSSPSILSFLLKNGANINQIESYGWTPLHYAANYNQNEEIFNILIDNGATVDAEDNENTTPLLRAAGYNHNSNVVKKLLDSGANVHQIEIFGWTAIHYASRYNKDPSVIKLLYERRIDINATTGEGWTPLQLAIRYNEQPIVKYLIEKGADARVYTPDLMDLFELAVLNKDTFVIEYLLRNVDNDFPEEYGDLLYEMSDDRIPIINEIKKILKLQRFLKGNDSIHDESVRNAISENEIDINGHDLVNGKTLLHLAAFSNDIGLVQFLLDHGANVSAVANIKEMYWTPLHSAVANGNLQIIKLLVDAGANINATSLNGLTPLHYAAKNGNLNVVKLLVELGANVSLSNADEESPIDLARNGNFTNIIEFLEDYQSQ